MIIYACDSFSGAVLVVYHFLEVEKEDWLYPWEIPVASLLPV